MSPKRVIIVGGGVAGPMLAYWLGKNGFSIVVVERSPHQSQSGQVVDIEGPSEEILARMGLLDEVREKATHEEGVKFIDDSGQACATFPAGQSGGATKEIEIMRPVLAELLYEKANALSSVEFRFGRIVSAVKETKTGVTVNIRDEAKASTEQEEFDFLVACDGLRSKTRDLVFGADSSQAGIKSLDVFAAFFSVPREPNDGMHSRVFSMGACRTLFLKPINETHLGAIVAVAKQDVELYEARKSRDLQRQREAMATRIRGRGWETDRIAAAMLDSPNFYFEEISQIKLPSWSTGRCVLLGDAAWCPSPLTGQGTNAAILGAYMLADKIIARGGVDISSEEIGNAFVDYETELRPYMEHIQQIPLGGRIIRIVNPESAWGVWFLRTMAWFMSWLKLYQYLPETKRDYANLPNLT